jgi:prepilin-type N-terminal cleavage/methylation domain-containing protein
MVSQKPVRSETPDGTGSNGRKQESKRELINLSKEAPMKRTASWPSPACPAKYSSTPGRGGFTLIELLVVIAVIGILAALLLSTLSRAKEEAYTTRCKSNLRQWGVALRMYVDDSQRYPPFEMKDNASAVAPYWHQRMQPYTATVAPNWSAGLLPQQIVRDSIYICPSYIRLGGVILGPGMTGYAYNQSGYNVGAGELGLGEVVFEDPDGQPDAEEGATFPGVARVVRETEVIAPHDMIAVADAVLYTDLPQVFSRSQLNLDITTIPSLLSGTNNYWPAWAMDWGAVNAMRQRHLGIWNVVFCEGHVEGLQPAALFYPQSSVTQRWNRDHQPHPEHFWTP